MAKVLGSEPVRGLRRARRLLAHAGKNKISTNNGHLSDCAGGYHTYILLNGDVRVIPIEPVIFVLFT